MKFQVVYKKQKQFILLWIVLMTPLFLLARAGMSWAAVPDAYEPDNNPEEAQAVAPFDPLQQHSFHQFFDEDWFKFFGAAGLNYRISASPQTDDSDPVIELYYTDGVNLLVRENDAGPGEGELLGWKCLEDGYYYVRFTNNSPYFGTDVSYTFFMDTWSDIFLIPSGYIQGIVTSDGQGVGGVTLTAGSGGIGLSHSDGWYVILLKAGSVELSARKDGYYPRAYTVNVEGDQTTHLNIELEKIPTPGEPPVISGTPLPVTTVGQLYSFIPTATDPDGDSMVFSISNKPSWASFNPDNGLLVGVPAKKDIGTYGAIVITVSDSQGQNVSLPPFFIEVKRMALLPGVLMLLNKEKQP